MHSGQKITLTLWATTSFLCIDSPSPLECGAAIFRSSSIQNVRQEEVTTYEAANIITKWQRCSSIDLWKRRSRQCCPLVSQCASKTCSSGRGNLECSSLRKVFGLRSSAKSNRISDSRSAHDLDGSVSPSSERMVDGPLLITMNWLSIWSDDLESRSSCSTQQCCRSRNRSKGWRRRPSSSVHVEASASARPSYLLEPVLCLPSELLLRLGKRERQGNVLRNWD